MNCYPNLKAAKHSAEILVTHLANALQASPFTQPLEGVNPSLTPSRSLCKESAPGKDMLRLLHVAHTHHKLSELVTCSWIPRLLTQWPVVQLHSPPPCSQTSPQLSCIHLWVAPACLASPALPAPLFCWGIFFTYIPYRRVDGRDRWKSTQPLNHSTFGKGRELVFNEPPHVCWVLC